MKFTCVVLAAAVTSAGVGFCGRGSLEIDAGNAEIVIPAKAAPSLAIDNGAISCSVRREGGGLFVSATNVTKKAALAKVTISEGRWELSQERMRESCWMVTPETLYFSLDGSCSAEARLVAFDETDETALWQGRIDAAAAAGGGVVEIPAGRHPVAGLELRSGITLKLAEGCVLEGIGTAGVYRPHKFPGVEGAGGLESLVFAGFATNVTICGKGEIFGNGGKFGPLGYPRPRGLCFYRCRGIELSGFTLRDPGSWSCYFKECVKVHVDGVTLDSHGAYNNDGFDIDAADVLIENCDIDVGDDAICPKSMSDLFVVENIEVRNCVIRSCCAAIKFGGETSGAGFRNIYVHDCRIERCKRGFMNPKTCEDVFRAGAPYSFPGMCGDLVNIGAIDVQTLDGASIENFTARNLEIVEAAVPIYVRTAVRSRPRRSPPFTCRFGSGRKLKNVLFENIRAQATSHVASSILGVGGIRPEGITLRNVELICKGAGASRTEAAKPLKEIDEGGSGAGGFLTYFPAYGVYVRHADNVVFDNVRISYTGGFEERQPVVAEDVTGFRQVNCSYMPPKSPAPGEPFLRIGVVNDLSAAEEAYLAFKEKDVSAIVVSGCVGPATSDDECRRLRALRDKVFDGPDRPEVIYRYTGHPSAEQQILLDANGDIAVREYKTTGVLVFSSNVIPERRRAIELGVNYFEFASKTVLVFDGKSAAEKGGAYEVVEVCADPVQVGGKTFRFTDDSVLAQATMWRQGEGERAIFAAPGERGIWESRPLVFGRGWKLKTDIEGAGDDWRVEFTDLAGKRLEDDEIFDRPVKLRVIAMNCVLKSFSFVKAR